MSDYDFSALSARSFEKLIQALTVKIIGPHIVVFGDGPDGGREATFEGPIPYPTRENGWNGYGIVQAKFRQRTKDKVADGEWGLQQLRAELKKISSTSRNLRKPEYYIFATNVVLTPANETGSKDRAVALLEQCKSDFQLKGFDIWDYDKLVSFLDGFADIRRRYAAWITSGDILAKVIEQLSLQSPNFERTLSNFLQKELVTDQYANLEQAGHIPDDRVPLADVFIDLPVSTQRENDPPDENIQSKRLPPGFVNSIINAATERYAREIVKKEDLSAFKGKYIRKEPGRYVLIGGPGQGKTTIGQFICQLFRAAILRERPEEMLSPEVKYALKEIYTQCIPEGIKLPSVRRFPVRVQLSEFATYLTSLEAQNGSSLLSYITARIRKKTGQDNLSVEDFRKWLSEYPWIIILDGLDEVPASSNRDDVLDAIRDFWIDASDCNADILVIATTRPQGYNDDFNPHIYHHHWLMPLSIARAMHYARRLVHSRYAGNLERQEKILDRLDRASQEFSTARLMRSPLQVTIMATLVDRIGQPPQERWNLFNEYYDVIYKREVEREIPTAAILRNHRPDIDAIHTHVGLLLQVKSEHSGQTDARLSTRKFSSVVQLRLKEEGYEGEQLEKLKSEIIHAATSRLVFLVGLEANAIGFEVRSLQEFMAAEGLMNGSDVTVQLRLRQIAPIINWRNVFLFAAGKCFAERQHLRDTVLVICAELNESPDDPVAHSVLAGSHLALELLEDGPARRQPKYTESLTRIALRILDFPPCDQHARLADLYNPALERLYKEELEGRLLQDDPARRSGAWACLISLIRRHPLWAEKLNAYWPSTAEKQFQLLSIATEHEELPLMNYKLGKALPDISPLNFYNAAPLIHVLLRGIPDRQSLAWASALAIALNERSEESYQLKLSDHKYPIIQFKPLTLADRTIREFINLREMPEGHREWLPLTAAARFIAEPSAATLASELSIIADHFAPRSAHWLAPRVPWPMGACLAAADDEAQLRQLIDKIRGGELGDINEWLAAETRWRADGVKVSDIEYVTNNRWPYDKNIDRYGFPFIGCDTHIDFSMADHNHFRLLADIYSEVESSFVRSKVASWALLVLSSVLERTERSGKNYIIDFSNSREHGAWPLPESRIELMAVVQSWDFFKSLADDAARYGIAAGALAAICYLTPEGEDWKDWINHVGNQYRVREPRYLPRRFVNLLAEAFRADPSQRGILKILSLFTYVGAAPEIPRHLLQPDRHTDLLARQAAILIAIVQPELRKHEVVQLAQQVAECCKSYPAIAASAIMVAVTHRENISHFDDFILALKISLSADAWPAIRATLPILNDSLRRRTSGLDKRKLWSHLELPY